MSAWSARFAVLGWVAMGAVAAGGWYITATRLARIGGADGLASGVGALAAAVAVTLVWRWATEDRRQAALARGRCPVCGTTLEWRHEHADGHSRGLVACECNECGYTHAEEADCPDCAA